MKKFYPVLFVIISFLSGCSDSVTSVEQYDSSINGKSISIHKNNLFTLELDANTDGGYQWDYTMTDSSVLRLDSTSLRPKDGNWNKCGGLYVRTFYFLGTKEGSCTVNLFEHQAWMKDVEPINTVQFSVIIK